jgi:hypothetical protein
MAVLWSDRLRHMQAPGRNGDGDEGDRRARSQGSDGSALVVRGMSPPRGQPMCRRPPKAACRRLLSRRFGRWAARS